LSILSNMSNNWLLSFVYL